MPQTADRIGAASSARGAWQQLEQQHRRGTTPHLHDCLLHVSSNAAHRIRMAPGSATMKEPRRAGGRSAPQVPSRMKAISPSTTALQPGSWGSCHVGERL